ncbi:MAG TPA: DUF4922 domain-containing protein [Bacteroidota bacterium]|nr:DUF4922 domain-containing protein [Bacteroidota bacterium]
MDPAIQRLLLSDRELRLRGGSDLAERAHVLLRRQKETWPLLRAGYAGLSGVLTRSVEMDGFAVRVQWNPARIISSSASVDPESIGRRKCFLCPANLPPEQRGILFGGSYLVLCNPYPIFDEHFTVAHTSHTPQRIGPSFGTMLDLARAMEKRYTLIYNGPKCGASAPDHLHFQAGEKGFLPIEKETAGHLEEGEVLSRSKAIQVVAVDAGARRYISLRSPGRETLIGALGVVEAAMAGETGENDEPMMNILAWFARGEWTALIFPRAKHRPSAYFAQGEERLLISPAAVDCGGVLITPLERDYHRLTADHISVMFAEIFLSVASFKSLCSHIAANLNPL